MKLPPERLVQKIGHDELLAVTHLMQDFPAPWYVSRGWAIDAFLGRVTRQHEDLEIGIARQDQGCLHVHLVGWQLYKLVPKPDDVELVPWLKDEQLELPIHQIVVRNEEGSPPEFEFFLNEIRVANGGSANSPPSGVRSKSTMFGRSRASRSLPLRSSCSTSLVGIARRTSTISEPYSVTSFRLNGHG